MFLICDLPKDTSDVDAGLDNFFSALRALENTRYFEKRWWALDSDVWGQTEKYRDAVRERFQDSDAGMGGFVANALNGSEHDDQNPFAVTYHWGPSATTTTQLWLDVRNPHPEFGTAFSMFEDIVEALVRWQRPTHLSWVWQHYRTALQPIDKRRRGVGWIGWIPFDVTATEVPQAAIARPMAEGTFLASQRDFWFSNGANADVRSIDRAQALDHQLNALGVLPTTEELKAGTWPPA